MSCSLECSLLTRVAHEIIRLPCPRQGILQCILKMQNSCRAAFQRTLLCYISQGVNKTSRPWWTASPIPKAMLSRDLTIRKAAFIDIWVEGWLTSCVEEQIAGGDQQDNTSVSCEKGLLWPVLDCNLQIYLWSIQYSCFLILGFKHSAEKKKRQGQAVTQMGSRQ